MFVELDSGFPSFSSLPALFFHFDFLFFCFVFNENHLLTFLVRLNSLLRFTNACCSSTNTTQLSESQHAREQRENGKKVQPIVQRIVFNRNFHFARWWIFVLRSRMREVSTSWMETKRNKKQKKSIKTSRQWKKYTIQTQIHTRMDQNRKKINSDKTIECRPEKKATQNAKRRTQWKCNKKKCREERRIESDAKRSKTRLN